MDGEEVTVWVRVTSGVEEMSRTQVSIDETCRVVVLSDEGDNVEVFSYTGDDIELKKGICSGILKTGDTMVDGMVISTESGGVIDSGKHVAS